MYWLASCASFLNRLQLIMHHCSHCCWCWGSQMPRPDLSCMCTTHWAPLSMTERKGCVSGGRLSAGWGCQMGREKCRPPLEKSTKDSLMHGSQWWSQCYCHEHSEGWILAGPTLHLVCRLTGSWLLKRKGFTVNTPCRWTHIHTHLSVTHIRVHVYEHIHCRYTQCY